MHSLHATINDDSGGGVETGLGGTGSHSASMVDVVMNLFCFLHDLGMIMIRRISLSRWTTRLCGWGLPVVNLSEFPIWSLMIQQNYITNMRRAGYGSRRECRVLTSRSLISFIVHKAFAVMNGTFCQFNLRLERLHIFDIPTG